ncbi:MAG TPA: TIGR01777 family protein [Epsilonproteobacteria bacterium]|nr:TIGR01777 family protein [Campylobacterota bacterium]
MKKHKIAIAGASGFVGGALQKSLNDVVILHRNDSVDMLITKLQDVDVVINLAGAPIVKRWSENYKKVLHTSRIETTQKLVLAINKSNVSYFISTSAIGIYPSHTKCDEMCNAHTDDFLAKLCEDWEEAACMCTKPTAILRLGVVLGKEGGALSKMLLPFKLGLGGNIGDGKMMTSWITIDDLVGIYYFLIDKRIVGIFNAVSPHPVSNATFTKALGQALHRPTLLPLPKSILKLMYGEASCVLTDSKEVYPQKLLHEKFDFRYPTIENALKHTLY